MIRQIYVPTVFENYVADLQVDGVNLKCALCDTAGQRDYDRFRPLSYSQTDIFCICFSIDDSDSLDNIEEQVGELCCTIILYAMLSISSGILRSSNTNERKILSFC